jgi:hypothetical protein
MKAMAWVRNHKARTCLVAIATVNALYLLWCSAEDQPSSSIGKLLIPFLLLSSVYLNRVEGRNPS